MRLKPFAAVLALCALVGCGGSDRPSAATRSTPTPEVVPATTVTIEQIEKQNAAARRREALQRRAKATPTPPPARAATKPHIVKRFIPFSANRRAETAAYAERHYGDNTYQLNDPKVIVEHYTVTASAADAIAIFTPDIADAELHELPGTCSHFVIDRDGTIYQLVPLNIICRHTVGLNDVAIGIEHAGFDARSILDNSAMMRSSLDLTRWLQCRYGIRDANVIGHNESVSSPYHHEDVPALRTQTHQDWTPAEMAIYRKRLARKPPSC